MKRFLLDVNVLLDLVLDRAPFGKPASALWAAAEREEIEALVSAHSVTTVFYLVSRERSAALARRVVSELLVVPSVAAVDEAVLRRAMALAWPDFEDAVCAAAAEAARCDILVTRDPKDFTDSPVLALDPPTALSLLNRPGGPDQVAERVELAYSARQPRTRRSKKAAHRAS